MDYLFFDIECADGHNICSFGYVITNANFDVLEKKDILVNPDCKFKLSRADFDPRIKFAYSEDEFFAAPKFDAFYAEIASLLTHPDRILLGHSVSSDINYIFTACRRYNLKQFKIEAYDTQVIYAHSSPERSIRSLAGIMEELGVDASELCEHKSCDDAEMTMRTVEGLCRESGRSIDELLAANPDCIVNKKSMAAMHMRSAINKAVKNIRRKYDDCDKRENVYISSCVVPKNADGRIDLLKAVYRRGLGYTTDMKKCKYFVSDGRYNDAERKFLSTAESVEKLTFEQLGTRLHIVINGRGERVRKFTS